MGLDVQIYALTEPTDDLCTRIADRLNAPRNPEAPWDRVHVNAWPDPAIERGVLHLRTPRPYLEVTMLDRYFGLGYARGNWLTIRAMLLAVIGECPPETVVMYGHDCSDCAQVVDDELIAELDALWDSLHDDTGLEEP